MLIKGTGDRAFCAGGDVRGKFELVFSVSTLTCFCADKLKFSVLSLWKLLSKFSAVAEAGQKGDDLTKVFFKEEYMLNYAIGERWKSNIVSL